ncbi:MAG: lineage-specific thermal regulator protein, partial [Acidobacteria bacterium]|nr:lineage-specific thermal regulator protein [Acidobacteriota bacterium]
TSSWGVSDTGRRARFYDITKPGRRQLRAEAESWKKTSSIIDRFLEVDQT